jgi:glycosyltransferase involved in cell wall biosynthesis
MSVPLVSILVPVYNGEAFLAECLDSILAQDFSDFELLVSDDNSKDGSVALIQRYAQSDSRLRWWRNPKNLGLGGNLNICLKEARGEYIKYVLQDDKLLEPGAVRRLVAVLDANASASLAVSASHLIDAGSRLNQVRNNFKKTGVLDGKKVIVHCMRENANLIGEPSLVLFRKRQAARGFDDGFKQLIDLEMWFHLLEQGDLAYIAEPLCAFRQHPEQQTAVNARTGASAGEDLVLFGAYFAKPWLNEVVTAQAVFTQAYYFGKRSDPKAKALSAQMAQKLGRKMYLLCWLRHKVTRPFRNLSSWLQKRGVPRG